MTKAGLQVDGSKVAEVVLLLDATKLKNERLCNALLQDMWTPEWINY